MSFRCRKRTVNPFMRQIHKKWFVLYLLLFHIRYCMIRQQISHICTLLILHPSPINIQSWIPILSLSLQPFPMIETGLRISCVISHMPFAKESSRITSFLQIFREKDKTFWERCFIIDNLMGMRI